jgi:hypothetical protein
MSRAPLLASEMGNLQTAFYVALLLALFGAAILLLVAVGARQLVPVWRAGHPVIAALAGLVLLSVVLFVVVGTWATVAATFHG